MQAFRRFERSTTLFVVLVVLSFLLATLDVRAQGQGATEMLRQGTQALFGPVQSAFGAITRPIVGVIDGLSSLAGLREENDILKSRIIELEQQLDDTETLEAQVEELRRINDLAVPEDLVAVTARIYASSPSDFDQVRFIDKGSADGIIEGQPVVDENGLVGRIDLVTDDRARVRLITDPTVSVGVRVKRTGEVGWVDGRGDGPLRLQMFRAQQTVIEGDRLVTDGSRFPPELDVAIVSEGARSEVGFSLTTSANPVVELSRIDFVKVLIGWSPLDSELADAPQGNVIPDVPEDLG